MGRQHQRTHRSSPSRFLLAAGLLLGLASACSPGEAEAAADASRGLHFASPENLLGQMFSGEDRTVEFGFRVREEAVQLTGLETTCGCTEEQVVVDGRPLALPARLEPGTEGRVRVQFSSAGFLGEKDATITVRGEGPGLPAELKLRAFLKPWFQTDPSALDLGPVDLAEERRIPLRVQGLQAFRLMEPERPLPFGITVEGVPTPEAAREHALTVVLPARPSDQPLPEERQLAVLRLPADRGFEWVWTLAFEYAGSLYVEPYALLLQRIERGVRSEHAVEVGVREGSLAIASWKTEAFDGLEIQLVTLEEGRRYSFQVVVPANLELDGPVLYTKLVMDLVHTLDGQEHRLQREVKITAVLTEATSSGS